MAMDRDGHASLLGRLGVLCYLSLIIAIPLLLISPMIFDAPGSQDNILNWIMLGIIAVLPVALFFAPRFSKKALASGKVKLAYAVVLVPLFVVGAPFFLPMILRFLVALGVITNGI